MQSDTHVEPRVLRIDPADNVSIALAPLAMGDLVDGIHVREDVPAGHKVASRRIEKGEAITKFGYPIGTASVTILRGRHVHTHNVASALPVRIDSLTFKPAPHTLKRTDQHYTFEGYRRPDGRAATRNEIWIVNTVGCVNNASQKIAEIASREFHEDAAIDGIYAFTHPFGCSQLGNDLQHTQKVLAGLVNHPNAAAVLILGLGCENNQIQQFLALIDPQKRDRVRYFNAQEVEDEIEAGVQAVRELAEFACQAKREPIPVSELTVAMKCGGSDGFSSITANPLVGRVANRLTSAGATVILSEVPEMFGAEQVLLERACDETAFRGTVDLVNNFRAYFEKHGERIDENPSPGNKAGGITTLAEKSLGCVLKGGKAPVSAVLRYGETAKAGLGGLALVNAPGNDGVSSTAMTVAGAHVLLFTTGRGTPMGFPIPTVKISTNTELFTRKPQWIDFNAGSIVSDHRDMEQVADELLAYVLDIASGKRRTRSEINGFREIAIWKDGVTL